MDALKNKYLQHYDMLQVEWNINICERNLTHHIC